MSVVRYFLKVGTENGCTVPSAVGIPFSTLKKARVMSERLKYVGSYRTVVDAKPELQSCHPATRKRLLAGLDPSFEDVLALLRRYGIDCDPL